MSDYTKTTNFGVKDLLSSGDPNKIIKGEDFDTEFDALAVAIATKASLEENETVTGNWTLSSTITMSGTINLTGTSTIDDLTSPLVDINGGAIDGTTIGATSAAAGSFTTLSTSSSGSIGTSLSVGTTLSTGGTATLETGVIGSPTGGDKGAGTLNVDNQIYTDGFPINGTYTGKVELSGGSISASYLPAGWSVVRGSTGYTRIYHNLGIATTDQIVVTSPNPDSLAFMSVGYSDTNYFNVYTYNSSGSVSDRSYTFIFMKR